MLELKPEQIESIKIINNMIKNKDLELQNLILLDHIYGFIYEHESVTKDLINNKEFLINYNISKSCLKGLLNEYIELGGV